MNDELCELLPVSQYCPQLSSQAGLHQHVQIFTVFKRPVQPEHKQEQLIRTGNRN